jgi:hypothetical protein
LDQAAARLQEDQSAAAAAAPASPQPRDPLAGVRDAKPPLTTQDLTPAQTEGLMRAERTLESLEHYQRLLGDESKSLKQVSQAVQGLEGEVRELTGVLDGMDSSDQLYGILQEVAVTAMVHSLKFNRGDFNPPS